MVPLFVERRLYYYVLLRVPVEYFFNINLVKSLITEQTLDISSTAAESTGSGA
jgi:hypothetical protein